jgi:TPR repeat protein
MKEQYDKALAWYLLAARENNSYAQNNIGFLYYNGRGVPINYLCALKWYLKSAEGNKDENASDNIGKLFEHGQGVPPNKYKALEWFYHGRYIIPDRLNKQGYHLSATDKSTFNSIIDSLY